MEGSICRTKHENQVSTARVVELTSYAISSLNESCLTGDGAQGRKVVLMRIRGCNLGEDGSKKVDAFAKNYEVRILP